MSKIEISRAITRSHNHGRTFKIADNSGRLLIRAPIRLSRRGLAHTAYFHLRPRVVVFRETPRVTRAKPGSRRSGLPAPRVFHQSPIT